MFILFYPEMTEFIKKNWVAIAIGVVVILVVNQKLKSMTSGNYDEIERKVRNMN